MGRVPLGHRRQRWKSSAGLKLSVADEGFVIVDCPYCGHAWKAELRWIAGSCERCGLMVYRYADPRHD